MQETKQEKQRELTAEQMPPNAFLDTIEFKVQLTYKFTDPETKITFYCVLEQSETEKENAQRFYGLTKDERAARLYDFNRDRLVGLTSAAPDGLPGFEFFYNPEKLELKNERQQVQESLRNYFLEQTPIKKMVLADALDRYASISKPIEFFR